MMRTEEQKNAILIYDGDKEIAKATIEIEEGPIYALNSTYVDTDYRGQGLAGKLVELVVEKAKRDNALVRPVCTYAIKAFEKNQDYQKIEAK